MKPPWHTMNVFHQIAARLTHIRNNTAPGEAVRWRWVAGHTLIKARDKGVG